MRVMAICLYHALQMPALPPITKDEAGIQRSGEEVPLDDVKMSETLREAVGVFHNPDRLQVAIDELQSSGPNHHDISLLASRKAIENKLGHVYVRSNGVENQPDATHQDYRSRKIGGTRKAS